MKAMYPIETSFMGTLRGEKRRKTEANDTKWKPRCGNAVSLQQQRNTLRELDS